MTVFTVLICALVLAGWIAIWFRHRHAERRHRARQEEWDRLAQHYSDLDLELDRVWYGR